MTARLLALCVLVSLLITAGCGGGSSELSPSEFRSKAGSICTKYTSQLKRLFKDVKTTNVKQLTSALDKSLPVIEKGNGELAKLRPPRELRRRYKAWTRGNRDEVRLVKQLRDGIKAGNIAVYVVALRDLEAFEKEQDRIARQLGLRRCASS